jgi:hypothetical protein
VRAFPDAVRVVARCHVAPSWHGRPVTPHDIRIVSVHEDGDGCSQGVVTRFQCYVQLDGSEGREAYVSSCCATTKPSAR